MRKITLLLKTNNNLISKPSCQFLTVSMWPEVFEECKRNLSEFKDTWDSSMAQHCSTTFIDLDEKWLCHMFRLNLEAATRAIKIYIE